MNVTTDPLTLQVYVDRRESHRMYLETVKLCDFYLKKNKCLKTLVTAFFVVTLWSELIRCTESYVCSFIGFR